MSTICKLFTIGRKLGVHRHFIAFFHAVVIVVRNIRLWSTKHGLLLLCRIVHNLQSHGWRWPAVHRDRSDCGTVTVYRITRFSVEVVTQTAYTLTGKHTEDVALVECEFKRRTATELAQIFTEERRNTRQAEMCQPRARVEKPDDAPDAEICAVTQVDTLQAAVAIIPVLDNVSVGVFPLPTPLVCLGQSVHAFIGYGAALHKTDSL